MSASEHVIVRPGDKLIVRVDPRDATMELVDRLRTALDDQLQGVEVVVLAAEQVLVYRASEVCDVRGPMLPKLRSTDPDPFCDLPAGHGGMHRSDNVQWRDDGAWSRQPVPVGAP